MSTPTSGSAAAGSKAQASKAGAKSIDACKLVTKEEATSLLGADPGPGKDTSGEGSSGCAYGSSLTVGVDPEGGKDFFDNSKVSGTEDVSGIGDGAHLTIVAGAIAQMIILTGSTILSINVQGDPTVTHVTDATMTDLGRKALARL